MKIHGKYLFRIIFGAGISAQALNMKPPGHLDPAESQGWICSD
jgi:hypothetical protein